MKTIYIRTNKTNGKQYVGQTSDFKRRERDWRKLSTRYANQEINEDRKKYGLDSFSVDIVKNVEDCESDEWERHYILKYNTMTPNGYNHYNGGIKGFTFEISEETKKKMSDSLKGKPKNWKENGKGKIAEAVKKRLSKRVDQIDIITGEVLNTYPSAKEAARLLGYSQGNISNCCNGGFYRKGKWVNKKQYNGYIWKYNPL